MKNSLLNSHIKAQNGRNEEVDSGPENCMTSLLHFHSPPMNSLQHVSTSCLVILVCHLIRHLQVSEPAASINKYHVFCSKHIKKGNIDQLHLFNSIA